jgi:hypothetical protein
MLEISFREFLLSPVSMFFDHPLRYLALAYVAVWLLIILLWRRAAKENAVRFLLTTASLAFMLGFVEMLAFTRVIDYRSVFKVPILEPWRDPAYLTDPELLYIHKPNRTIRGRARFGDLAQSYDIPDTQAYRFDLTYDSNGFRNARDLKQADIAVLGDSFIMGAKVTNDQLMTEILSRLQGRAVINLAQPGYGPQQELITLKRYALPVRPRFVVWAFFEGNDLEDFVRYEEVKATWSTDAESFHAFRHRSFISNAVSTAYRLFNPKPRKPAPPIAGTVQSLDGKARSIYFDYPGLALSADDEKALERIGSALREAGENCVRHGARLIVVFVPTKFRVYGAISTPGSESIWNSWVLNDLPDRLRQIVNKIPSSSSFLDLTPSFQERAPNGELLYYADDSHWSPEGHELAARTIDEFIRRTGQTSTARDGASGSRTITSQVNE